MCEPSKPDALLEAVRGLRVAEPDLGFKPLLAKLREQQPDLHPVTFCCDFVSGSRNCVRSPSAGRQVRLRRPDLIGSQGCQVDGRLRLR
eukprot:scaffold98304_cov30-Phaeocystis_antarctica.AAC.1